MAHALAEFIDKRMHELELRQRDVVAASGLSRSLVSKQVNDQRDQISRLPERATLEGFARALRVPVAVLLAKAVESLGLGYQAGDFINELGTSDDQDLLDEIARRLAQARQTSDADANVITLGTGSGKIEGFSALTQAAKQGGQRVYLQLSTGEYVVVDRAGEPDFEIYLLGAIVAAGLDFTRVAPFPLDSATVHGSVDDLRAYLAAPRSKVARDVPHGGGKTDARAADQIGTGSQDRGNIDDPA